MTRTNRSAHLDYSEHNLVKKFFQTYTMRIGRFHETGNGSQTSAERWLTAYSAYYNPHRPHQALGESASNQGTQTGGLNLAVPSEVICG